MQTTWQDLKQRASDKQLSLQFVEYENKYTVSLYESMQILFTFIDITNPRNADQIDFEDNFKNDANGLLTSKVKTSIENEIVSGSISVSSSNSIEAKVSSSRLQNRQGIIVTPLDRTVYWGGTNGVTTSNGTPIFKNQSQFIAVGNVPVYLIASGGSNVDVRIVEVS